MCPSTPGHRLVEITGEGCLFEDTAAGKEVKVPCDAVVLAMGMRPNQGIADQFRAFPNCQAIGTCVAYGNIACAVESGSWQRISWTETGQGMTLPGL